MLWQIPLLLTILSASQITAAPVNTHKGMEGNAIASLFQRPEISDELFKSMQRRSDSSVVITDEITEYTVAVDIGSPATDYTQLVDPRSTSASIRTSKSYTKTSTSFDLSSIFSDVNESSDASGSFYSDEVVVCNSPVTVDQVIGHASKANVQSDVDGTLGLGPTDPFNDASPDATTIPTVLGNYFIQKSVTTHRISLSYQPSVEKSEMSGETTSEATESSKYTGSISSITITKSLTSSQAWGVDASAYYGTDETPIFKSTVGIIDAGTPLIRLAADAFQAYQRATGAILDETTGLLTLTAAQFDALQSLYFTIREQIYELNTSAQIFTGELNTPIGEDADKIYLIIIDGRTQSGSGQDFVRGEAFSRRPYAKHDSMEYATTGITPAASNQRTVENIQAMD
ncbi:unnamed protein product [Umbelopsis ramanniana]